MSIKEEVIKLVQSLPDDVSVDDLMYHIYVKETVLQRINEIKEGRATLLSEEEVEGKIAQWFK